MLLLYHKHMMSVINWITSKQRWNMPCKAMNFLGSWLISIYNFDTKCYNMENLEMGDDNG